MQFSTAQDSHHLLPSSPTTCSASLRTNSGAHRVLVWWRTTTKNITKPFQHPLPVHQVTMATTILPRTQMTPTTPTMTPTTPTMILTMTLLPTGVCVPVCTVSWQLSQGGGRLIGTEPMRGPEGPAEGDWCYILEGRHHCCIISVVLRSGSEETCCCWVTVRSIIQAILCRAMQDDRRCARLDPCTVWVLS